MQVSYNKLITKCLPLDLHMSRNLFAWYMKEHMLEVKQTFVCVGDLLKKFISREKTKPVRSQRVGLESEQLGVTWLVYFITPSKMGKYQFQHVL